MAIILWALGTRITSAYAFFVVLSMLLVRKRGLYQRTGYSRYFSSGFYHGGLQFSSVSFFAEQILFGSISFPFYVDIVIETEGVGVMVCSCLFWLEPFFSFRVTSLFILWYCYALLTLKLFSCQNSTCSCYVFPRAFWSIHRHTRQNIHWFKSKPFGCVEPVCVCSPTMEARASTIEKHGSNSLISVMRRKTNCSMETLRRPQTRHYDSGRHFAPLLHLPYKNPKWGRTKGEWYTHLVYSPPLNIFFEIYQITAHKIQIFDKSDQAVEQRFVPLLPAGGTDDDDNGKAKDTEDLLTTFNTKKKREWTPIEKLV